MTGSTSDTNLKIEEAIGMFFEIGFDEMPRDQSFEIYIDDLGLYETF